MVKKVAAAPTQDEELKKAQDRVQAWLREIAQAQKREDEFRKEGDNLVKIYEGAKCESTPYNILYSNTETITPAVYSNTPRPNVRPRFKSGDQTLATAAAKVCQNLLTYFVDCGDAGYSTFDELIVSAVTEGLVPGRGCTKFKYDAEVEQLEEEAAEEGGEPTITERVAYATVCGEEVPWDRVLFGFAKKWKDVPWMAIAWPMTKEELVDNFGEVGKQVKLVGENTTAGTSSHEKGDDGEDANSQKIAWVYEIWAKRDKRVIFVSEGYPDGLLREAADPYELEGFFPMPKPLTFVTKIKSLVPVALYKLYQEQAEELNTITRRIKANTKALRQRGFYDVTIEGIDKVLEADDNEFLPASNVSALQQGQTLDRSIWMVPIIELVSVLQQLYTQRESCKSVIFEITGIADIMRGSSQASETLGAQQLKTQWGGLRLKKLQKAVSNYTIESLRIMAEIAFKKLDQETIIEMTGLEYPTAEQKAQAQAMMQQIQAAGQEVDPKQMDSLQQTLAMPSWEEILKVLRSDIQRQYKIDIETNSTVDLAATEDKQDVAELMNALAQFLNGITPLVESGSISIEAAQALLLAIVRRFRFGQEVEDQLKQIKAPGGGEQKPDPKAEAEQAKLAAETQVAQQQAELDGKRMQQEAALHEQEMQQRMREMQAESVLKEREHQERMVEIERKAQLSAAKFQAQMRQIAEKSVATAAASKGETT
jgi:hypothetical protein